MKQLLHIFAKDARRFWPEIVLSLAVTAAFVRIYPQSWLAAEAVVSGGADFLFQQQMDKLAGALLVLVPVSWWLLITRVIHAESLVGDRQFWITRPYDWRKLLGAKLLFVAVFVCLPFTCAQMVLLAEGGFRPFEYLPNLLFLLLLMNGALVIPLLSLAAVTRNFARMTMTLLAILVCILALGFAASLDDSTSANTPYSDRYTIPLIFLVCVSAIVVQYARRKVWPARWLLLSLPVMAVFAVAATLALPDWTSVDSAYPRLSGLIDSPVQISFNSALVQQMSVHPGTKEGRVEIRIPIQVEGVAPGHAVLLENVKASIDGLNGAYWSLPWEGLYNRRFLPGVYGTWIDLKMKRTDYERFKQAPIRLKLTFAMTEVRAGAVKQFAFSGRAFSVPEFGVCPAEAIQFQRSVRDSLQCRSAFHSPKLMYVSATESPEPCTEALGEADSQPSTSVAVGDWVGSLNNDWADFGFTPVWKIQVNLSTGDYRQKHFLCRGTPLTFTQYDLLRRAQMEVSIPTLKLPTEKDNSKTVFMDQ